MQLLERLPAFLLIGLTVSWTLASGSVSASDNSEKPNVLFIAIDDLRPELGCYGADHVLSPNIDEFSSQGVLFESAYCQAPHCAPSRVSLLTGVHTRHFDGMPMVPETLAPGKPTLPATFRKAGYTTINNGKIYHQREDDAEQSWSEEPFSLVDGLPENNHRTLHDPNSVNFINRKNNLGPFFEMPDVSDNTYIDGQTCEKTIKDMRRLAKMDGPFFLACGFVRPHLPFYAPKKYWDLYDREKIALADNRDAPKNKPRALRGSGEIRGYYDRGIQYNSDEFHQIARHGYYACVSYADTLVGKVLATLDELDLRDNTIVIVWGDHGWHLGEHNYWGKHNLLHNALRVPLIISAPGFKKNVTTDSIVELVDLYPTLCELAGIEPPEHLEGKSVVPLLQDPQTPGKPAAFTKWKDGLVVTTPDFTYTEYEGDESMLYERSQDPEENVNVADAPEQQQTVKRLSGVLDDAREQSEP
ncbi:Arylsulfatase [Rubripirellula obstinata]|uniref:Arylsulfatase n=1 Tax=Rubripirellula obstinata TaxID=406547 RepID=A0A5B1CFV6_9BACT|nr:sulfatase [Rubripirellula obstinata]KAA1259072.1 Arylsulfatase [Rubripirellula obstinata]